MISIRISAALPALACLLALANPAPAAEALHFQVDPSWPKPLPNDWIMGQLAIDSHGNVFTTEVETGKRAQEFTVVGDVGLPERKP